MQKMKLLHTSNNAYDMMLLTSPTGDVIGAYDYNAHEFAKAKKNPCELAEWNANYPDNTAPGDYGEVIDTITATNQHNKTMPAPKNKEKLTYSVANGEGNHIGVITNFDMEHYDTIEQMIIDHYELDEPLVEIKKTPGVKGILSFTYSDASDGYNFTSEGILFLVETVIYP